MDGFRCRSAAGAKDKEEKERCCLSLFPWSPQSPQAHFSQGLQRLVFRLFLSTLTNSLNQANILCFMHSSWDKSIYSFCANWSKWAKKGTLLRKKVHHRRLCGWDKYQLWTKCTVRDSSNESQKEKLEAVPVCTWWEWVSIGRYWLVLGGTGSVKGGTRSL